MLIRSLLSSRRRRIGGRGSAHPAAARGRIVIVGNTRHVAPRSRHRRHQPSTACGTIAAIVSPAPRARPSSGTSSTLHASVMTTSTLHSSDAPRVPASLTLDLEWHQAHASERVAASPRVGTLRNAAPSPRVAIAQSGHQLRSGVCVFPANDRLAPLRSEALLASADDSPPPQYPLRFRGGKKLHQHQPWPRSSHLHQNQPWSRSSHLHQQQHHASS